jgi:hypothetical protein
MKIKVSEATGVQLDWLVAKASNQPATIQPSYRYYGTPHQQLVGYYVYLEPPERDEFGAVDYTPSTSWAHGGPIVDTEFHAFDHIQSDRVCAIIKSNDMYNGGFTHGYGPTILIAAMRCLVVSKLGDEVEVPDELS